jgi:hypothetical protein
VSDETDLEGMTPEEAFALPNMSRQQLLWLLMGDWVEPEQPPKRVLYIGSRINFMHWCSKQRINPNDRKRVTHLSSPEILYGISSLDGWEVVYSDDWIERYSRDARRRIIDRLETLAARDK